MNEMSSVPDEDIDAILRKATILESAAPTEAYESAATAAEEAAPAGEDESEAPEKAKGGEEETIDVLTNWKIWEVALILIHPSPMTRAPPISGHRLRRGRKGRRRD